MTFVASCYGRLGKDPRAISTASGKAMASASIAVDVSTSRDPDATHWLPVLCFGRQAEVLLQHQAGECLAVCGRLQRNVWTDKDGAERVELQMIVDTLTSARTARPVAHKRERVAAANEPAVQLSGGSTVRSPENATFVDDVIPF